MIRKWGPVNVLGYGCHMAMAKPTTTDRYPSGAINFVYDRVAVPCISLLPLKATA